MNSVILSLNYFPNAWKLGEIVLFLKTKQNKLNMEASSYRPVSLLQMFGKIFKTVILNIINYFIRNSQELNSSSELCFMQSKSIKLAFQEVLLY